MIGDKNLSTFNKVLLCKWTWWFMNEWEALWNQIVRGKDKRNKGEGVLKL